MSDNESAAYWRQIMFAAENFATADKLREAGFDRVADVYLDATRRHARQARELQPDPDARAIELRIIDTGHPGPND